MRLHARRGRTAATVPLQTGFAVLDLETTGLSPRTDRIVEAAVVCLDANGTVVSEFCTLVNPERDIGPTHLHGLRASDVATAPRFADIAALLLSQLADRLLVGHNLQFDLRFLDAELGRLGVCLPQGLAGLCTSEASLGPPSSRTTMIGQPQRAIGHQGECHQGPAVCQTDCRRPLRQGPIGFPTGWPLRKWLVRQRVC